MPPSSASSAGSRAAKRRLWETVMETRREAGLRRVIKASSGVLEDQRLAADQSGRPYVPGGTSHCCFRLTQLKNSPRRPIYKSHQHIAGGHPVDLLQRLRHPPRDRVCLPCFALQGATATSDPHASLILANSVSAPTGIRQEFVCSACGQRMARFLAQQVSPPPADVWRFQQAEAKTEAPSEDSAVPLMDAMPPVPDLSFDETSEPDYPGL